MNEFSNQPSAAKQEQARRKLWDLQDNLHILFTHHRLRVPCSRMREVAAIFTR